jgi:hypothetical protein
MLGVLIVGFASIYWCLGVPTPTPPPPHTEGLQYISLGTPAALHKTTFWAALLYSLQTASIGRLHYFGDSTPLSPAADFFYAFESILGPVQIALFAVALRNRFRR